MNNSREKFEAWWGGSPKEYSLDMTPLDKLDMWVWASWQAATEQSQKEIEALQAREKVLIEALQNLVEDISKTHGNYTYEQAWINADEALANVRGEDK